MSIFDERLRRLRYGFNMAATQRVGPALPAGGVVPVPLPTPTLPADQGARRVRARVLRLPEPVVQMPAPQMPASQMRAAVQQSAPTFAVPPVPVQLVPVQPAPIQPVPVQAAPVQTLLDVLAIPEAQPAQVPIVQSPVFADPYGDTAELLAAGFHLTPPADTALSPWPDHTAERTRPNAEELGREDPGGRTAPAPLGTSFAQALAMNRQDAGRQEATQPAPERAPAPEVNSAVVPEVRATGSGAPRPQAPALQQPDVQPSGFQSQDANAQARPVPQQTSTAPTTPSLAQPTPRPVVPEPEPAQRAPATQTARQVSAPAPLETPTLPVEVSAAVLEQGETPGVMPQERPAIIQDIQQDDTVRAAQTDAGTVTNAGPVEAQTTFPAAAAPAPAATGASVEAAVAAPSPAAPDEVAPVTAETTDAVPPAPTPEEERARQERERRELEALLRGGNNDIPVRLPRKPRPAGAPLLPKPPPEEVKPAEPIPAEVSQNLLARLNRFAEMEAAGEVEAAPMSYDQLSHWQGHNPEANVSLIPEPEVEEPGLEQPAVVPQTAFTQTALAQPALPQSPAAPVPPPAPGQPARLRARAVQAGERPARPTGNGQAGYGTAGTEGRPTGMAPSRSQGREPAPARREGREGTQAGGSDEEPERGAAPSGLTPPLPNEIPAALPAFSPARTTQGPTPQSPTSQRPDIQRPDTQSPGRPAQPGANAVQPTTPVDAAPLPAATDAPLGTPAGITSWLQAQPDVPGAVPAVPARVGAPSPTHSSVQQVQRQADPAAALGAAGTWPGVDVPAPIIPAPTEARPTEIHPGEARSDNSQTVTARVVRIAAPVTTPGMPQATNRSAAAFDAGHAAAGPVQPAPSDADAQRAGTAPALPSAADAAVPAGMPGTAASTPVTAEQQPLDAAPPGPQTLLQRAESGPAGETAQQASPRLVAPDDVQVQPSAGAPGAGQANAGQRPLDSSAAGAPLVPAPAPVTGDGPHEAGTGQNSALPAGPTPAALPVQPSMADLAAAEVDAAVSSLLELATRAVADGARGTDGVRLPSLQVPSLPLPSLQPPILPPEQPGLPERPGQTEAGPPPVAPEFFSVPRPALPEGARPGPVAALLDNAQAEPVGASGAPAPIPVVTVSAITVLSEPQGVLPVSPALPAPVSPAELQPTAAQDGSGDAPELPRPGQMTAPRPAPDVPRGDLSPSQDAEPQPGQETRGLTAPGPLPPAGPALSSADDFHTADAQPGLPPVVPAPVVFIPSPAGPGMSPEPFRPAPGPTWDPQTGAALEHAVATPAQAAPWLPAVASQAIQRDPGAPMPGAAPQDRPAAGPEEVSELTRPPARQVPALGPAVDAGAPAQPERFALQADPAQPGVAQPIPAQPGAAVLRRVPARAVGTPARAVAEQPAGEALPGSGQADRAVLTRPTAAEPVAADVFPAAVPSFIPAAVPPSFSAPPEVSPLLYQRADAAPLETPPTVEASALFPLSPLQQAEVTPTAAVPLTPASGPLQSVWPAEAAGSSPAQELSGAAFFTPLPLPSPGSAAHIPEAAAWWQPDEPTPSSTSTPWGDERRAATPRLLPVGPQVPGQNGRAPELMAELMAAAVNAPEAPGTDDRIPAAPPGFWPAPDSWDTQPAGDIDADFPLYAPARPQAPQELGTARLRPPGRLRRERLNGRPDLTRVAEPQAWDAPQETAWAPDLGAPRRAGNRQNAGHPAAPADWSIPQASPALTTAAPWPAPDALQRWPGTQAGGVVGPLDFGPATPGAPQGQPAPGTQALTAAVQRALRHDGHGQALPLGVQDALERTLGTGIGDIRVVRNAAVPDALRHAGAEALTVGRTVLLAPSTDLNTPAGRALAAHELTHALRQERPDFLPQVIRGRATAGRVLGEEDVALHTEHAARAEYEAAAAPGLPAPQAPAPQAPDSHSTGSGYTHTPGLPAPWEPLPFWQDTPAESSRYEPGRNADSRPAPAPLALPAPPPALLSPAALPIQAAATARPQATAPAAQTPPATGTKAPTPAAVDLDQVAREVYARLKDRLNMEFRRLRS